MEIPESRGAHFPCIQSVQQPVATMVNPVGCCIPTDGMGPTTPWRISSWRLNIFGGRFHSWPWFLFTRRLWKECDIFCCKSLCHTLFSFSYYLMKWGIIRLSHVKGSKWLSSRFVGAKITKNTNSQAQVAATEWSPLKKNIGKSTLGTWHSKSCNKLQYSCCNTHKIKGIFTLPLPLVDFLDTVYVGRYTNPMDPMGYRNPPVLQFILQDCAPWISGWMPIASGWVSCIVQDNQDHQTRYRQFIEANHAAES